MRPRPRHWSTDCVVDGAVMAAKFELPPSVEEEQDGTAAGPNTLSARFVHGERRGRFLIETEGDDVDAEAIPSSVAPASAPTFELLPPRQERIPVTGIMDMRWLRGQLDATPAKDDALRNFFLRDRMKQSKRKCLLRLLLLQPASPKGWPHLGTPEPLRRLPFIEPTVMRGAAGRLEFPREGPSNQTAPPPVITRRAITTLITGVLRKRYLDIACKSWSPGLETVNCADDDVVVVFGPCRYTQSHPAGSGG